ncbi:hypothetical protein [Methanolapillus millepedarum]|uniref:hypothetical protein n=1 Tax=Methanolapillus millepedarum TaxID=3028296 RepID=UPI0030B8CCA7
MADCENKKNEPDSKQLIQDSKSVSEAFGLSCPVILAVSSLSAETRRKLIQNKINFMIPQNQLYLPDLLMDLKDPVRQKRKTEFISPAAQLLILYHLQIESLEIFSLKEIAKKIGYTPKTITVVANELKSKGFCEIAGSKEKKLIFPEREKLWSQTEKQMRSPVDRIVYVRQNESPPLSEIELPEIEFYKSGDPALSHYTFIAGDEKPVYAVSLSEFETLQKSGFWKNTDDVEGDICIEIWKYNPKIFNQKKYKNEYIDPLSLYLCFREDENERVRAELNELAQRVLTENDSGT